MMIARLLRWVLLALTALAAGWAAWWIAHGHALVGVLGALALLLLHAGVLGAEFVLLPLANRGDPALRATARELLSAWWHEARLGLHIFAWQQPFRSQLHPDHVPSDARGRRGVVLVHGFMCNRGFWNTWLPRLRERDVPFVAVDLEPPFGSIDAYASAIDTAVQRLHDATGLTPVIVAHSMGGLATRAWLQRAAEADADEHAGTPGGRGATMAAHKSTTIAPTIITIGSPHRGTVFGHRGPMVNVGQMRRGSGWLEALARSEPLERRQRFVCFYSHCDNIVLPASTATLDDADNRHLRAMAHVQLIEHPAVLAAALDAVAR